MHLATNWGTPVSPFPFLVLSREVIICLCSSVVKGLILHASILHSTSLQQFTEISKKWVPEKEVDGWMDGCALQFMGVNPL